MKMLKTMLKPFIVIKEFITDIITAIQFYIVLVIIIYLLYSYFKHNQSNED